MVLNEHDLNLDHVKTEKYKFYFAFILIFSFILIEVSGGIFANSLALISDGLHLAMDSLSLILAIFINYLMTKKSKSNFKTFGYQRAEIIGALLSCASLFILTLFLMNKAIYRLIHPTKIDAEFITIIAIISFFVNLAMERILHTKHKHCSLNIKAAYLHVLSDLLGSLAIILSGIIIWVTDLIIIDPICTLIISTFILYSTGKIIKKSFYILMEHSPIDTDKLREDIIKIKEIKEINKLHVWMVSTKNICMTLHITIKEDISIKEINDFLKTKYNINQSTIQIDKTC